MRLRTYLKKNNNGVVSIDNLRSQIRKMVKEYLNTTKYKNNFIAKINLTDVIEMKVIMYKRGAHLLKTQIDQIEKWIEFFFKDSEIKGFNKGYAEKEHQGILLDLVYSMLSLLSEKDYYSAIKIYPSIDEVNDEINAVESGCIPESALDSISVDSLEKCIDDIYRFYFRRVIK